MIAPKQPNKVLAARTVAWEGGVALTLSVDVNDAATASAFVFDVVEAFKVNRMIAPPTTNRLLITVIGEQTATQFANEWHLAAAKDPIVGAFMSKMAVAEVVQGTAQGAVRSQSSLLPRE